MPRPPSDARRWRLAWAALLIGTALLATCELDRGALEVHESYVVETATEMAGRGEWVVPWFNDAPRLRKPPMSYWLTALAGRATGEEGRLHPWHGRLVSALAGVGLVALIAWMGTRLFDRPTGLLAGAMAATTQGVFHYAHSARADLLYAFWAGVAMAGFVRVWKAAESGRGDAAGAALVWGSFAAATLTKGPQIPVMLLVAFGVWAWREGGVARRAFRGLRPLAGIGAWVLLAVPWWIALEARVGGLGGTQLAGSLLRPGLPAADYLYRVPQLLAPWSILLPVLAVLEWQGPEGRTTRWLAAVGLVPVLILSLASQQRAFYALPVLAPFVLAIAAGARSVVDRPVEFPRLERWVRWAPVGFAGLVVVAATGVLMLGDRFPDAPADGILRTSVLLVVVLGLGAVGFRAAVRRRRGVAVWGLAAVAFALFGLVGGPAREWTKGLDEYREIGTAAARYRTQAGLCTWRVPADDYVYYTRPPVREIESESELLERVGEADGGIVVIGAVEALEALPPTVRVEPLVADPGWTEPRREVARLTWRDRGL